MAEMAESAEIEDIFIIFLSHHHKDNALPGVQGGVWGREGGGKGEEWVYGHGWGLGWKCGFGSWILLVFVLF